MSAKEMRTDLEQTQKLYSALEKVQNVEDDLCLVEKVHDKDDVMRIPEWKTKLNRFSPLFSFFAVAAYWLYFGYRIHCVRDAEVVANRRFAMAWTFIAVELGVACKHT